MKYPLSKGEIVKDFIRALLDTAENQIEEPIRNTHSTPPPKPLAKKKKNHQARTTSTAKESTMTGITTITTILLSAAIITTATIPDKCMPYGVIQPEEKFKLVHTQKEALNISNYINNMKTISTGAKDLRRQLEKAITTAPKEGKGDPTQSTSTIKQVKSYILPQIMDYIKSVSYTHLTLPTIYSV